jgi:aldehyde dehydrogenase (NAD+)
VVNGGPEVVAELLRLPFNFLFFAGRRLQFGGGCVNQTMLHALFNTLPFGGVGSSGIGQYSGKTGFDSFSHDKSILFSGPDVAVEEVFPPYDATTGDRFIDLMTP